MSIETELQFLSLTFLGGQELKLHDNSGHLSGPLIMELICQSISNNRFQPLQGLASFSLMVFHEGRAGCVWRRSDPCCRAGPVALEAGA